MLRRYWPWPPLDRTATLAHYSVGSPAIHFSPMKTLRLVLSLVITALFAVACSKTETAPAKAATPAKHEHKPPHGGTPVVLGKEVYHLELVRDAAAGKLTLYVMDGELENFVRVAASSVEIVATVAGKPAPLVFQPIANPATGEKLGDTSQFEATADWLKTTAAFDAVLTKIEVRGTSFAAVAFNFPKGNDTD